MTPSTPRPGAPPTPLDLVLLLRRLQQLDATATALLTLVTRRPTP
jgi:hypothetical protein